MISSTVPHPWWATHATRLDCDPSLKESGEKAIRAHAELHCPKGLTYAVRYLNAPNGGGAWEWYAPAQPADQVGEIRDLAHPVELRVDHMRVSDLTDRALDYWVARAYYGEGVTLNALAKVEPPVEWLGASEGKDYSPSTNWLQGGPLIEERLISITYVPTDAPGALGTWEAFFRPENIYEGPTPLIAAMRAYVASRFGDEVPETAGTADSMTKDKP